MTTSWWLSSETMTVQVDEENDVVVDAAPIVRKFIGQPMINLVRWMKRQGGFRWAALSRPCA